MQAPQGRNPIWQRATAIPAMLRDGLSGRWPGAPRMKLLAAVAGLVYVISPIDFMPEALLGPFGLGDDIAILALIAASFLSAADDWLDWRAGIRSSARSTSAGEGSARTQPPSASTAASDDIIQGVVIND